MATELERLDALLTKQEKRIREAFLRYLAIVGSRRVAGLLADMIEQGETEEALRLLESHLERFGDVLADVWRDVGEDAADELAAKVPEVALGIGFDVTHERAAAMVRNNRLRLIKDLTLSQRLSVRQALERAMRNGAGPAETARQFRQAIGLAPTQEAAVTNYRALLEARDRRALERELRDRRYDRQLSRAIERERPLTPRQIDTMVSRYRGRYLIMRSENIARTEGLRATSEAREEAAQQMLEQTGFERGRLIRIWRSTHDKRVREWHESMDRQERLLGQAFEDGKGNRLLYPGDPNAPGETTINCRCTVTFRIAPER